MFGADERETRDPWAPGGAMSSGRTAPPPTFDLDVGPVDLPTPPQQDRSGRARLLAVTGAIVAGALIAGVIAITRATRPDDAGPAANDTEIASPTTTSPSTSLLAGTLPTANPLSDIDDPAPPTTIRPRTAGERFAAAEPPRFDVIAVPVELAGLAPTEVVALQSTEGLYEISLPSGRVRITDLDYFAPQGTGVAVNDAGTIIWPTPEGGHQLIGVDRTVGIYDRPLSGVIGAPGSNSFVLWPTTPLRSAPDAPSILTIQATEANGNVGSRVVQRGAGWLATATPRALVTPSGGVVVADTGGSYLLGSDGTKRITTGDVIANGRNHILVRECDEALECSLASLDRNGSRTLWATDLPAAIDPQRVHGLAPSGDALLVNGARFSADQPREFQVIELLDGTVTSLRASPTFTGLGAWANDSSGVFFADQQLLYLPRSGDPAVVVSPDLPQLRAVRTRQPAQAPVCELLDIALLRFEEMQDSPDAAVGPPSVLILNRLIELSPDDLASAAQPLVTFVGAFVSAETPDSQVVENWPADVQAGLDALVTHDRATC